MQTKRQTATLSRKVYGWILDKITKMLGNFEYFYDLDGRFIFQAKKTYVNTSWSPIIEVDKDMYVENAAYADQNTYYFTTIFTILPGTTITLRIALPSIHLAAFSWLSAAFSTSSLLASAGTSIV